METERPRTEPTHAAGEDPAASAVTPETRQWVTKTLVLSFLLPLGLIAVIGAVWFLTLHAAPRAQQLQVTHTAANALAPRPSPISRQLASAFRTP
jgi:hypothetical protein